MGKIYYRDRNEGKFYKDGKKKKPNWAYRFEATNFEGKRVRIEKAGFAKKQDAIDASVSAYQEFMGAGEVIKPSTLSFSDCLDHWMENYVSVQCREATYTNYEKCIRLYIKPALGVYKMSAIQPSAIQKMVNDLAQKKYSMSVIRTVKGICNKSFKYAKRNKWILNNNALDIDMPSPNVRRTLRKKERKALTKDEIEKMFQVHKPGTNAYFVLILAYRCGLRKGEIYGLTWDDFDFDNKTLSISRQMQYLNREKTKIILTPKYDSFRIIDVDDDTMLYAQKVQRIQLRYKRRLQDKYIINFVDEAGRVNIEGVGVPMDFIFKHRTGECYSPETSSHYFKKLRKSGFEEIDLHSLRHTHATELASNGLHIKEIQRRLGHKTEDVTMQKYVHASDEMRQRSIELINSMFLNSERDKMGTRNDVILND